MIKEVPHSTLMLILAHYNEIWKSGMIPQEWKHALINPILKPGKNPRSPESYRPISLTATLCKIMEKMVTKRLTWYLESKRILSKAQTGFRKGKNTMDQIIKIHNQIHRHINSKGHTIGVFLDFEKAYDLIWKAGLMSKVKKNRNKWKHVFIYRELHFE